jgi:ribosome-binding protein aMBF1 (putative translation factor)
MTMTTVEKPRESGWHQIAPALRMAGLSQEDVAEKLGVSLEDIQALDAPDSIEVRLDRIEAQIGLLTDYMGAMKFEKEHGEEYRAWRELQS